ncbi:ABC transporter permease [Aldersonia kunmingensis]|uniref:ABC transporter permease n=1 Tax=Aldersonia kunmingensis TaxID=408066 RepID=UPI000836EA12|nr:ABC transporter permease [Aldersonia kunmingensis]
MNTGLLVSESRKVTTLNFWWALPIAPIVVGMFASAIYAALADSLDPYGDSGLSTGAATIGIYFALAWVILFAGIFGAVNAGTDFRHKTLTPTFLVAPRRDSVVASKLIVTAVVGLAYGVLAEAAGVICMSLFGGGRVEWSGTFAAVLAAGLVATVCWALIGAGLGLLLASPIGAALALVAWYLVGEITVSTISAGLGFQRLGGLLPGGSTLSTVAVGSLDGSDVFVSWPAAPVLLLAWTALFAGGGWLAVRVRDVL